MDNPTVPAILLVSGEPPSPALAHALRESFPGVAVQMTADEAALRSLLAGGAAPVLLCDVATPAITLDVVAQLLKDLSSPARLVALAGPDGQPGAAAAMVRGARDLVSVRDLLHLRLALARELDILPAWRERNAALLGSRPDEGAEALMEGDELTWASDAFARLLGRASPTQIARKALWLCIDGEDHHLLRRALHSVAAGHSRPAAPLHLRAVAPDGRHLRLAVTLHFEREGDKPVVRLSATKAGDAEGRAPPPINVETLKRLRAAIAANGLAIAVQPITPLAAHDAGDLERIDVLIRVRDAGGEMTAAEFMREASAAGLLRTMDHWVIRYTCAMSAKHAKPSLHFLRLSRQTLQDPTTLSVVRGAIASHRVLPGHLSFEMTESEFVALFPDERAVLQALKKDGCRLTLSQFGARPESLDTLDRLPLDYVKLDVKLTGAVGTAPAREQLRLLVQRADARNVSTISTRVADAMSLAELWKLGIRYVQGYYVHEPAIVVGA